MGKRLKDFVNTFIIDIPDDKKSEFYERSEELFLEAIEHGMEGTARGLKEK